MEQLKYCPGSEHENPKKKLNCSLRPQILIITHILYLTEQPHNYSEVGGAIEMWGLTNIVFLKFNIDSIKKII